MNTLARQRFIRLDKVCGPHILHAKWPDCGRSAPQRQRRGHRPPGVHLRRGGTARADDPQREYVQLRVKSARRRPTNPLRLDRRSRGDVHVQRLRRNLGRRGSDGEDQSAVVPWIFPLLVSGDVLFAESVL